MGKRQKKFLYSILLIATFSIVSFSLLFSQNSFASDGKIHVDTLVQPTGPGCHGTYDEWTIFPASIADSCDAVRDDDGSGSFLLDTTNGVARSDASKDSSWKFNGVTIPGSATDVSVTFTAWLKRTGTTETDTALLYEEGRGKKKQAEFEIVPPIPLASTLGASCPDGSPNDNGGFCPYSWIMLTHPVDGSTWTAADVLNWDGSFGLRNKNQQFSTIEAAGVLLTVNFPDNTPPIGTLTLSASETETPSVTATLANCDDEGASGCTSAALYFDNDGNGTPDEEIQTLNGIIDGDHAASFDPISLDDGRGEYHVVLVVCDVAGNCNDDSGAVPDDADKTVELFATHNLLTGPLPASGLWGIDSTDLTADWTNALDDDKIEFYGDAPGTSPTDSNVVSASSDSATGTLTYPSGTVGTHTPSSCLTDSAGVPVVGLSGVLCESGGDYEVLPHATSMSFTIGEVVDGKEGTVVGLVTDEETGDGVDSLLGVTFTHEGNAGIVPDTNTAGIRVNGATGLTAANALILPVGATITTLGTPTYLEWDDSGMPFGTEFHVTPTISGMVLDPVSYFSSGPAGPETHSLSGGTFGLDSAEVSFVDGAGTLDVKRVATRTSGGALISDVTFAGITVTPSMEFAGGAFISEFTPPGLAQADTPEFRTVVGSLLPDPDYITAGTTATYNYYMTSDSCENCSGPGGTAPVTTIADAGTGVSVINCPDTSPADGVPDDADKDAICDLWEISGGVPYLVDGASALYPLPFLNAGTVNTPNLIFEYDYMGAPHDPRGRSLNDVRNMFAANGISVTWLKSDSIPHLDIINMWRDIDGVENNDYKTILENFWSSSAERVTTTDPTRQLFNCASGIFRERGITVTTPAFAYDSTGTPLAVGPYKTQGNLFIEVTLVTDGPTTVTSGASNMNNIAGFTKLASVQSTVSPTLDPTVHKLNIKVPFVAADAATYALSDVLAVLSFNPPACVVLASTDVETHAYSSLGDAKKNAVRHLLFAHGMGGPSGFSELRGNNAAIFLGEGFGRNIDFADGTPHIGTVGGVAEQDAAIAHEIGHMVNLRHGGPGYLITDPTQTPIADADINCKFPYLSIMSYSRTYPFSYVNAASWSLDYSHGTFPGVHDETVLVEDQNVSTPLGETVIWGGLDSSGALTLEEAVIGASTDFDFDHDGAITAAPGTVSADPNNFGFFGCFETLSDIPYRDYDDWSNLDMNWKQGPAGQFDGPSAAGPPIIDLGSKGAEQSKIANSFYDGPVPPLSLVTETTAGKNHPIKVFAFYNSEDEADPPNILKVEIVGDPADGDTVAVATIVVRVVGSAPNSPPLCEGPVGWDPAAHFHFDCKSNKNKHKGEQLNVSVFLAHPDSLDVKTLLRIDDNDPLVNPFYPLPFRDNDGNKATMLINLAP